MNIRNICICSAEQPFLRGGAEIQLAQAGRQTVLQRFTLAQHVDQVEAWLKSILT